MLAARRQPQAAATRRRSAAHRPGGRARPARRDARARPARLRDRLRGRRSSSSTRSTRLRTRRSSSGSRSGSRFALLAAACIVIARRARRHRGARGALPAAGRIPTSRREIEQIVAESGCALHAQAAAATRGGRCRRGTLGLRVDHARALARARRSTRGRSTRRRGAAARGSSTRPDGRSRADDDRGGDRSTPRIPEGADREQLGSPLVVVRLDPAELRLPAGRGGWAPDGILAYSKICTHAGCAIALYRKPTFADVEPGPRSSARATTRPSTRPTAARCSSARRAARCRSCRSRSTRAGDLRAAGNFSGPVGPSWWGVRRHGQVAIVIRRARPLPRRAHRRRAVPAQGAALRLPRPLVVPARRGRALRFLVLVATGIYLTLFFEPSLAHRLPRRPTRRCTGATMSHAYALRGRPLASTCKAGLLIRQTHHWAADVFVAAIVLHLLRVFFTGAFRKPRDLTYCIGLAMLVHRAARGLPRLLAGRRPALGHGARDRLRGRARRSRSSARTSRC